MTLKVAQDQLISQIKSISRLTFQNERADKQRDRQKDTQTDSPTIGIMTEREHRTKRKREGERGREGETEKNSRNDS